MGVAGTLKFYLKKGTKRELAETRLRRNMRTVYGNVIRGGLDYANRKDEMHWEINSDKYRVGLLANKLRKTKRGKRLMKANPQYKR